MSPASFSPDVQEFLRLLASHSVRYLIVGGEAVIYHGYVRLTGDVDIFFDASADNVPRLFAALVDFWAGNVPGIASAGELGAPGAIFMFGRPPNRLDLLNRIDGVAFDEAWATRVPTPVRVGDQDVEVSYIGLEALLKNKRAAGRAKDQDDLAYLEAVQAAKNRTSPRRRS
ncbi:MAG: nucleotidyltransferase [Deltaproteobacteria bacterium]|nr:nucleotidyltransferase [Deltaproteobacteria bacterium]